MSRGWGICPSNWVLHVGHLNSVSDPGEGTWPLKIKKIQMPGGVPGGGGGGDVDVTNWSMGALALHVISLILEVYRWHAWAHPQTTPAFYSVTRWRTLVMSRNLWRASNRSSDYSRIFPNQEYCSGKSNINQECSLFWRCIVSTAILKTWQLSKPEKIWVHLTFFIPISLNGRFYTRGG